MSVAFPPLDLATQSRFVDAFLRLSGYAPQPGQLYPSLATAAAPPLQAAVVANYLRLSGLPQPVLFRIWALTAGDRGVMQIAEFVSCMYIVEGLRGGTFVLDSLPETLPHDFPPRDSSLTGVAIGAAATAGMSQEDDFGDFEGGDMQPTAGAGMGYVNSTGFDISDGGFNNNADSPRTSTPAAHAPPATPVVPIQPAPRGIKDLGALPDDMFGGSTLEDAHISIAAPDPTPPLETSSGTHTTLASTPQYPGAEFESSNGLSAPSSSVDPLKETNGVNCKEEDDFGDFSTPNQVIDNDDDFGDFATPSMVPEPDNQVAPSSTPMYAPFGQSDDFGDFATPETVPIPSCTPESTNVPFSMGAANLNSVNDVKDDSSLSISTSGSMTNAGSVSGILSNSSEFPESSESASPKARHDSTLSSCTPASASALQSAPDAALLSPRPRAGSVDMAFPLPDFEGAQSETGITLESVATSEPHIKIVGQSRPGALMIAAGVPPDGIAEFKFRFFRVALDESNKELLERLASDGPRYIPTVEDIGFPIKVHALPRRKTGGYGRPLEATSEPVAGCRELQTNIVETNGQSGNGHDTSETTPAHAVGASLSSFMPAGVSTTDALPIDMFGDRLEEDRPLSIAPPQIVRSDEEKHNFSDFSTPIVELQGALPTDSTPSTASFQLPTAQFSVVDDFGDFATPSDAKEQEAIPTESTPSTASFQRPTAQFSVVDDFGDFGASLGGKEEDTIPTESTPSTASLQLPAAQFSVVDDFGDFATPSDAREQDAIATESAPGNTEPPTEAQFSAFGDFGDFPAPGVDTKFPSLSVNVFDNAGPIHAPITISSPKLIEATELNSCETTESASFGIDSGVFTGQETTLPGNSDVPEEIDRSHAFDLSLFGENGVQDQPSPLKARSLSNMIEADTALEAEQQVKYLNSWNQAAANVAKLMTEASEIWDEICSDPNTLVHLRQNLKFRQWLAAMSRVCFVAAALKSALVGHGRNWNAEDAESGIRVLSNAEMKMAEANYPEAGSVFDAALSSASEIALPGGLDPWSDAKSLISQAAEASKALAQGGMVPRGPHCELTLLPLCAVHGISIVQWDGRRCMAPVANFWVNKVKTPPPV